MARAVRCPGVLSAGCHVTVERVGKTSVDPTRIPPTRIHEHSVATTQCRRSYPARGPAGRKGLLQGRDDASCAGPSTPSPATPLLATYSVDHARRPKRVETPGATAASADSPKPSPSRRDLSSWTSPNQRPQSTPGTARATQSNRPPASPASLVPLRGRAWSRTHRTPAHAPSSSPPHTPTNHLPRHNRALSDIALSNAPRNHPNQRPVRYPAGESFCHDATPSPCCSTPRCTGWSEN